MAWRKLLDVGVIIIQKDHLYELIGRTDLHINAMKRIQQSPIGLQI